jgi:hypothetical protein
LKEVAEEVMIFFYPIQKPEVVKNHITYIIFEERREKPLFGLASHTQKMFALWPKQFICLAKFYLA